MTNPTPEALAELKAALRRTDDHLRSFADYHPEERTSETEAILWCNNRLLCARLEPRQPDGLHIVRRIEELPLTPFSEAAPVRDELMGEQTILTYSEAVGVWSLEFFEGGWEFPGRWIGGSHWIDITSMWPGVTAQVTEFHHARQPDELSDSLTHRAVFDPASEPLPDALADVVAYLEQRRDNAAAIVARMAAHEEMAVLAADRRRQLEIQIDELRAGLHLGSAAVRAELAATAYAEAEAVAEIEHG